MKSRTKVAALAAICAVGASACSVQPATEVTGTSATLHAKLTNPLGDYAIAYGWWVAPVGEDLGPTNPAARVGDLSVLAPATPWTELTRVATGLKPGTAYHYTICGSAQRTTLPFDNPGSGCLPEQTFTTPR